MNENLSRLAYLYNQYRDGKGTREERSEFMEFVNNDDSENELNILIEKDIKDGLADRMITASRAEELYQLILEKGKKQANDIKPVRIIFTLRRMAVAASAVFMLGLATYFLLFDKNVKNAETGTATQQPRFKNDIPPGGNKAILTLADGSTIILDSASNGSLTKQGASKIIKLANGELVYKAGSQYTEMVYNKISTPKGGQYRLTLADGSKVWLNAASSLRYPASFSGGERKVELTGEAYFEVAKNTTMPFKVKAAGMEVRVLGTHFNINAYDDEATIKTTLLEGAVKITKGNKVQPLSPGQQAEINPAGEIKLLLSADTEETMAWKNGQFVFTGNDIQSVMRQLEKWYDIDVAYSGALTREEFVGIISRNVNISQILNMLEKTRTVHFEINDRKVIVK